MLAVRTRGPVTTTAVCDARACIPKTSFHFMTRSQCEADQAGCPSVCVVRLDEGTSFSRVECQPNATSFAHPDTPVNDVEPVLSQTRDGAQLDARAQLTMLVSEAWRLSEVTNGKNRATLPELYLAYLEHTGEELRCAMLRVINEPLNNPNRHTVMDLIQKTLGDVVRVTRASKAGRFGEALFFVTRVGVKRKHEEDTFPTGIPTGIPTVTNTPLSPSRTPQITNSNRIMSPKPIRTRPSVHFQELEFLGQKMGELHSDASAFGSCQSLTTLR